MALNKTPVDLRFDQGLDLKTDSKQVPVGKFLGLKNSVFGTNGLLQKRNGYKILSTTPEVPDYITTLNGNLTGVGSSITAYSESQGVWLSKGQIEPVNLSTLPLIHNNINHTQTDAAMANNLICTVYTELNGSTASYKYAIADAVTGQNIVAPVAIPVTTGAVEGTPRVFTLGNYFVIVFTNNISGTYHIQYIAISVLTPTSVTTAADIAASYIPAPTTSWDAIVFGTDLYIAYNTTAGGQAVRVTKLSANAAAAGSSPATPVTYAGQIATMFTLCVDSSVSGNPIVYVSYFDAAGNTSKTLAVDQNLFSVLAPTSVTTTGAINNLASTALNGVCTLFYEVDNDYTFGSGAAVRSDYIASRTIAQAGTVTPAAGSASSGTIRIRSVGLASKAVLVDSVPYFLGLYQSLYQSTYFLIRGDSTASSPKISAKLAYGNALSGGDYYLPGLPSLINDSGVLQVPYLITDLIASASKETNPTAGTQTTGVYTQFGINLVRFVLNTKDIYSAETAKNLHITGGFLWQYDGYLPIEHGFFLYPDNVNATWSATGGNIAAQPDGATNTSAYYYQVTYEWSDNQGNIYRSAPSLPLAVTTTGNGTSGSITVKVPTLRLTYKTANPVKIVIYRWSVAQQVYYQATSISAPLLNSTTSDSVTFVDTLADASILGNSIIYTTGGVVENVEPPAVSALTLFDDRLWAINSEDPNVLLFSKPVIQSTPVEMSDLFTIYIAPTTGVQGPGTGPSRALCGMDDKLIVFKDNALYYINGKGPDITGANSQYSQPIFITAAVGSANPDSIVVIPQGIMFQSNKGIWLLGRDLSTKYIGAPVESYNDAVVQSAVVVPSTTQVRIRLDIGVVLMYDYFYDQWGTFTNVPGTSSVIYNDLDTYINIYGQVFQETPGLYLDGTSPVLLGFTTAWISLAGLQGYERFYHGYLLGTYYTPFKLNMNLAYDYNPSSLQSIEIVPDNYTGKYGSGALYGSDTPYGGPGNVFEARFFPEIQKCETFQVIFEEVYDPSYGVVAGAGLSLSGLNLIVGVKKGSRTQKASQSFG